MLTRFLDPLQEKAVTILESITAFMTQNVRNNSVQNDEKLVEQVGTALLNGLGNLLDITAYEASESINDEDAPLIAISNERREKVRAVCFGFSVLGLSLLIATTNNITITNAITVTIAIAIIMILILFSSP